MHSFAADIEGYSWIESEENQDVCTFPSAKNIQATKESKVPKEIRTKQKSVRGKIFFARRSFASLKL